MTDSRSIAADPVTWLDALLLPTMRYRMALLGVDGSGAYGYYDARLAKASVFAEYEIRLFHAIVRELPQIDEIHEIGCGWGQLVFLLAWRGYDCTGFEIDEGRFLTAQYLHAVLRQIDAERASRARIVNAGFPAPAPPPEPKKLLTMRRSKPPAPPCAPVSARSLVISTNIVGNIPETTEDLMIAAMRQYRYAVVDIDRFCNFRQAEQRPALMARLERAGLRNLGLLCDLKEDAQLHLFESVAAAAMRGNKLAEPA